MHGKLIIVKMINIIKPTLLLNKEKSIRNIEKSFLPFVLSINFIKNVFMFSIGKIFLTQLIILCLNTIENTAIMRNGIR